VEPWRLEREFPARREPGGGGGRRVRPGVPQAAAVPCGGNFLRPRAPGVLRFSGGSGMGFPGVPGNRCFPEGRWPFRWRSPTWRSRQPDRPQDGHLRAVRKFHLEPWGGFRMGDRSTLSRAAWDIFPPPGSIISETPQSRWPWRTRPEWIRFGGGSSEPVARSPARLERIGALGGN
jgi:hypothetical protein